MIRKRLLLLSLLLLCFCFGCTHKPNPYESYPKLILGDWKAMAFSQGKDKPKKLDSNSLVANRNAFTFYSNDTLDYKAGFWKIVRDTSIVRFGKYHMYLGSLTSYKLHYDSLLIYFPDEQKWKFHHIDTLYGDTMLLTYYEQDFNSSHIKMARQHYNLDTTPTFDTIIISTTGCFGTCPYGDVMISSNGNVTIYAGEYTDKNGLFTARVSLKTFQFIQDNFRKADIKNIPTKFESGWSDQPTIYTTFIKSGKIYKSIYDYGPAGPAELQWAYSDIAYLYDQTALKQANYPEYMGDYRHFGVFQSKDTWYYTSPSISFLLWNYIKDAKPCVKKFEETYTVISGRYEREPLPGELYSITTDGRYYKLYLYKKDPITLDLGFNFLEVNHSILHSTKRDKDIDLSN